MKTTVLHNEIIVHATLDQVWEALTQIENLEKYDPTVLKSVAVTTAKSGLDAKRKVTMRDGKNWFEEKVTVFEHHKALTYQLTDCSFPIHGLKHTYRFEPRGDQVLVQQTMEYSVKWGLFGRLMDALMIKKQTDKGIKAFFGGLKSYLEAK